MAATSPRSRRGRELTTIARAMREIGAGWLQVISDFDDPDKEFAMLRRLAAHRAGRWR